MVDWNLSFASDTVSGIERAKKNWCYLWTETLVEMTHWLSRIFPRLPEDSVLSTITSALVAKVLMGGYQDSSELGEATWERILLLINRGDILASCEELGVDWEVVQKMFKIVPEETVPNLDTISPAALAWFARKKVRWDLEALGVDREVIRKYTR